MEKIEPGLESIYTVRYAACFELYLQYGGREFRRIEREMRELGFAHFHRRILYSRTERGVVKPGWVEKFRWRNHLSSVSLAAAGRVPTSQYTDGLTTPSAQSGVHPSLDKEGITVSYSPPVLGGVAPASGDGVVTPSDQPEPYSPKASFEEWLKQVSPELTWDWKYQKHIYKYLERVTDGTCKRLMIFMPPRHGKSELVTIRYAGWRLWNDPKMRVIVSSYNQKLADRFSRGIRKLLSEEEDRCRSGYPTGSSDPPRVTTPSAQSGGHPSSNQEGSKRRFSPPGLRRGGTRLLRDGVVTAPDDTQDSQTGSDDTGIRQACDHPQCCTPAAAAAQSQIANRNSQITRMFPRTRTINTASQWETAFGGGVKAVGVGAGVTGFGGQLIVIDDPVKSRAEAESATYRERLWDWYRNDLYTRLEPNAAVIIIQTRWHQDDLAGRLLQEMQTGGDRWDVIDLPALSEPRAVATGLLFTAETPRRGEEQEDVKSLPDGGLSDHLQPLSDPRRLGVSAVEKPFDPLGRPVGEALCPDRFDVDKLADIQRQLGTYAFSALYQQHPTPAEGGIFKRAWFTRFVDAPPTGLKWKRGYDLAVSTKTTACFTASFRVARDAATGNLYIADGFRERLEYPDQKRYIIGRVTAERDTEHGIEKALHGQALIQELRLETRVFGQQLRGITVTTDKVTRALTWAPLAEEGKVVLVRGGWNRAFLDELANFPAGQHDDQIDAVSLAVSMLDSKRRTGCSF